MRPAGGNHRTLQKWAQRWGIPTDHFDPYAHNRTTVRAANQRPLTEILVAGSTYNRGNLKRRLYDFGLKARRCELCGQDEDWRGRRMALILDHINGVADDNRLENLQIVCPNCAATLDTHCGRNLERVRKCPVCTKPFEPTARRHRFCSLQCWGRSADHPAPPPGIRIVERPPYKQLMREIEETNWSAVGRKYGVSDNAVRKWVRTYERQRKAVESVPRLTACGAYVCSSRLRRSPSSYSLRRSRGPKAPPKTRC